MNIKCLASDYIIKEKNDLYYVYNEVYEGSLKALLIASLIGLFIPDATEYYVPICIEIKKCKGNVIIGKKMDVIGSADFKYFIAKHQYEKWKKMYYIIKNVILVFSLLINIFFICLLWKTNFHLGMVLCVVCMLFITFGAIIKLELNNKKRKKYEIIDITF